MACDVQFKVYQNMHSTCTRIAQHCNRVYSYMIGIQATFTIIKIVNRAILKGACEKSAIIPVVPTSVPAATIFTLF